jgi:hypothetical protein
MANLVDRKEIGLTFPNQNEIIRVKYDFSVDTGAVASYTVLTADSSCVVFLKAMIVKTAVTSGGSLTLDLGKGSAGTEIISNKAVASMTIESLHVGAAPVQLDSGEIVAMNIEVAAATAGVLEFVFEVIKY